MTDPIETRIAWARPLGALPFAARIATAGAPVGLVHGAIASSIGRTQDFDKIAELVRIQQRRLHPLGAGYAAEAIMWARPTERHATREAATAGRIDGVGVIIHGHDPGPEPGWTGQNALCIDTGVHWPEEEFGHLSVAEIQTGEPTVHRFARNAGDALLPPDPGRGKTDDELDREEEEESAFCKAMGTTEHPESLASHYHAGRVRF